MSKCFPNVRAARGQVDSRVMIDERRTFSDDVVASSFLGHFRKLVFGRTALCCLLNAFAEATRSHDVGRAPIEGEWRRHHPAVSDRNKVRDATFARFNYRGNRAFSLARRGPFAVLIP